MQRLMLRLSPLFLFLLVFSCAKDHEVISVEKESTEMIQALHDGKKCDIPCRKPDYLHVSDIEGCSAVITWGFEVKTCGTFVVQLQNLATGDWTYYDPAVSPLTLTGLDPCTKYTVGVSHVTDLCASIPLQVSFKTDCRKCKECKEPCQQPDYLSASDITNTGATISFGHTPPTCGYFVAQLKNESTGVYTYYDPAVSPLVLTGLEPCTEYTIGISHVTDLQACLPLRISFTTLCEEPCDPEGLNPQAAYFDQFGFDVPGVIDLWDNYLGSELYPVQGYKNVIDPILRLEPATDYTVMFCYVIQDIYQPADTYIKMWIDFDDDGEFDANELVAEYDQSNDSGLCISGWVPEVVPGEGVCGVPGRIMISINNEITSPCEDIPLGQVIDFLVNVGECSVDP